MFLVLYTQIDRNSILILDFDFIPTKTMSLVMFIQILGVVTNIQPTYNK